MPTPSPKPPFLALCRAEPFRLFFPLGVLVGLSGVSLWPLFFSGMHKFYPGVMHARLMIEGFMGAFVIGFFGTAIPRLTGTAPLSRGGLWVLILLYAGAVGTHIAERPLAADCIFLALLCAFTVGMVGRCVRRVKLPPPGFVLIGFGFLNVLVGTVLLIVGPLGEGFPRCTLLGSMLMYQGFVLDLVLGVGSVLLPRVLESPAPVSAVESRAPTPAWRSRAWFSIVIGAVLGGSFIVEALTFSPRTAAIIRFAAVAVFLGAEVRFGRAETTIPRAVRLALALLALGVLAAAFWPIQRVAVEHLVFIVGFTLMAFTNATRLVFSHTGRAHLLTARLPFLAGTSHLLVAGAILRVAGDFLPAWRGPILSAASYAWMLAAAWWGWRVLPKVRIAGPE